MIYNKENGKSKGFAFCEYLDYETALASQRHLNGRELKGRSLKVNFSHSEKASSAGSKTLNADGESACQVKDVIHGIINTFAASRGTLSPRQMFYLLAQVDTQVSKNLAQTKLLLAQNPQLAQYTSQILLQLGLWNHFSQGCLGTVSKNENFLLNSIVQADVPSKELGSQHSTVDSTNHVIPADEQKQLLQHVLGLTSQQIAELPPDQKKLVIQLRTHGTL
mmetsp:Transcript_11359/g.39507  ORF Transcript_11359/g.39507 Transcript_11359/m.39507 type:complete len:221 (+) Transcript_11359:462-1124(+)